MHIFFLVALFPLFFPPFFLVLAFYRMASGTRAERTEDDASQKRETRMQSDGGGKDSPQPLLSSAGRRRKEQKQAQAQLCSPRALCFFHLSGQVANDVAAGLVELLLLLLDVEVLLGRRRNGLRHLAPQKKKKKKERKR